jgi:2,4-dienoyl-CoA reductase-like NADH-dependent reductase (Old Yellow Enzyme family)
MSQINKEVFLMASIFDPTSINGMTLKNRSVRSATWEGMCDVTGRPNEKLTQVYQNLAKGGVGLIITGYTFVRPEGKQLPGKMGIYTDDFATEMKALVAAAHGDGGKICMQLVHAGGQTDAKSAGMQPLAPSAVEVKQFPGIPAEMSQADINEVIEAFGAAALRAKNYGFDAVQLHGAHGYLVNQFLSPLTNQRTDDYGGTIENRCRFLLDVYQRVRDKVGNDYPVMIKLNAADNVEGGLSIEDASYAAKALDSAGIDAIEVSSGTSASGKEGPARIKINNPEAEAYNIDLAKTIKALVKCPVMVVGGFRSFDVVESALAQGLDYVAISRPFIREPDLINRWQSGDKTTAKCISCNACFGPGLKEGGIYCVAEKKEREKED